MKFLYLILFIAVLSFKVAAQETFNDGNRYFFIGIKLPILAVRDECHSPLIYRGIEPILRAGFVTRRTNEYGEIAVELGFGDLAPRVKPVTNKVISNASSSHFAIRTRHAYILDTYKAGEANTYLGFDVSYVFSARQYNLPSNNLYGYNSSFAISAFGIFQNNLKDNWLFSYDAHIPLISLVHRPDYMGLPNFSESKNFLGRIFGTSSVVTFNKKIELNHRFTFTNSVNDHHQRALSYEGQFLAQFVSKPLHSTSGGLSYAEMFKL